MPTPSSAPRTRLRSPSPPGADRRWIRLPPSRHDLSESAGTALRKDTPLPNSDPPVGCSLPQTTLASPVALSPPAAFSPWRRRCARGPTGTTQGCSWCCVSAHQSSGGRRRRLRSAPRRFAAKRRSREAAVGRVRRRCLGVASARASRSRKRIRANSRLRACDRPSCAIATTRGPTRASNRSRCASVSVSEVRTSKLASTREAVTLACCPPGPEERLARSVTSERGIVSPRMMRSRLSEPSSASVNEAALHAGCRPPPTPAAELERVSSPRLCPHAVGEMMLA
jgi:hypothetical protein